MRALLVIGSACVALVMAVPAGAAASDDIVTGADAGTLGPHVKAFDGSTGAVLRSFYAYASSFAGGVRVASGDVNGDGTDDIITAAGPGGAPQVKVFDGITGAVIRSFSAYAPSFAGGVFVAAADLNGDGKADIITGPGAGGSPQVQAFDGATGAVIRSFFAYGPSFSGGVRVAAGDVNGDGKPDIIAAAGAGGARALVRPAVEALKPAFVPYVKVFDGTTGAVIRSLYAYAPTVAGGVFVAAGDLNGDGKADIITGAGKGKAPHVQAFDGATGAVIRSFDAYAASFTGGVRVGAGDVNGDGTPDILTTPGAGAGPRVEAFDGKTGAVLKSFYAEASTFGGGLFVSSGDFPAPVDTDWLQFDGSGGHFGVNANESAITPANVAGLAQRWQITLPSVADGAPVVATRVQTAAGAQDLVIVTTRAGGLIARNLETGAAVWSITFGRGTCTINNGGSPCYTTSSPVVDRGTNAVFTYGLDGYVHKVDLGTGTEVRTTTWPVLSTLKPWDEKGSSALSSATGSNGHTYLYSVHAGYPGDNGDYQGHVTAIDLSTGVSHVFNTLCSDQTVHFAPAPGNPDCGEVQSGVWARAGVTYSSVTNRIYLATGNGDYNGGTDWGDSILALNPDGTGSGGGLPVDSYTPTNYASLQGADADLGSTLPALVDAPAGSTVPHLGVQGGKDGQLRLVNLANLSGQGGPGHTGGELQTVQSPGGGEVLTAPVPWVDPSGTTWIEAATDGNTAGYQLTLNASHQPRLTRIWQIAAGGTSPVVANGILFVAGGGSIRAYSPTSGAQLWSASTGSIHWQSPVVVDGLVLLEDGSAHLTAWGP